MNQNVIMPKSNSNQIIRRQWEILKRVPARRPGITVSDLALKLEDLGLGVDIRTIQRDLNDLSSIFSIVCDDENKPYGWYWMDGAEASLPEFSESDALSLTIIENRINTLLPGSMLDVLRPKFIKAKNKLKAFGKQKNKGNWLSKVRSVPSSLTLLPPDIAPDVLDTVQTALLNDNQLEIGYRSHNSVEIKKQTISPLAIVQRGNTPYLVATAFKYKKCIFYAIHRMHSAIELDDAVITNEGFNIDDFIANGKMGFGKCKAINLKAKISKGMKSILEETPLSPDQKITEENDVYILSAPVEDTWQLTWWLLSQCDVIEVIGPGSLRSKIKKKLNKAGENYE